VSVDGPFLLPRGRPGRSVWKRLRDLPAGAKRRGAPSGAQAVQPWPCRRSQVPTAGRTPKRTPVKLTGAFARARFRPADGHPASGPWGLRSSDTRQPAAPSGPLPMEKNPCVPTGETRRCGSRGLIAKLRSRRASARRSAAPAPWRRRRGGGSRVVQPPYIDKGMSPADTPINAWQDP
jgi:hypothetical protein